MAGNPQVNLGSLNRLVASASFTSLPALNVTPAMLARRAISFQPDGDATTFINMLAGMVTSPEPYVGVTFNLNLVRTTSLAAGFQTQWLSSTLLGECVIRPDVPSQLGGIQSFDLQNCGILRLPGMDFDGADGSFVVPCRGTYYINSDLWPN